MVLFIAAYGGTESLSESEESKVECYKCSAFGHENKTNKCFDETQLVDASDKCKSKYTYGPQVNTLISYGPLKLMPIINNFRALSK